MSDRTTKPGLVLTDNDVGLFRWLWMLRVMTLGQLQRVGYYQPDTGRCSSLHNVRKRLHRLWDKGYLRGDLVLETRERIYFLEEAALPALRQRYGLTQRRLYKARSVQSLRQLHHALMVSECAVRMEESIRGSGLNLVDLPPWDLPFYHTHAVGDARRKKHVKRFVSQEDVFVEGHPKPLRVRPDLVFALAMGSAQRLYFLEADRGSETSREIAQKLLAYHHYFSSLDPEDSSQYRWQRYGAMRDFRVLIVTTEQHRVRSLARGLAGKPGYELTALASQKAVTEGNLLFDPVWVNQFGKGRALARRPIYQ